MVSQEEFDALKKKVERCQREADRAQGAYEQQMKKLEEDFGCKSIEEAEEKLSEIHAQLKEAELTFESEFNAFNEKWGDLL